METDTLAEPPKLLNINIETHDLTEVRMVIRGLIKGMNAGPKSRARALAITKLQEAEFWAGEALFAE